MDGNIFCFKSKNCRCSFVVTSCGRQFVTPAVADGRLNRSDDDVRNFGHLHL